MSVSITNAFVEKWEAGAHVAYQQKGSKLRKTVRRKTGVSGQKLHFRKVGRGQAGKKSRHGNVPLMNLGHSSVTCTLEDWYAAEYIGRLDQKKVDDLSISQTALDAGGYALGRKIDELLIGKMDLATNIIGNGSKGFEKGVALSVFQALNVNDVPDDGNRFAVLGPHQWNELLNIEEFKNSDYAGDKYPWLKGTESRTWLGITWMFHTGLPLDDSTRKCFAYHQTALGLAEAEEVKGFLDWVPDKAEHLADSMLSAGACLIDPEGVIEIQCNDDSVIV
ncbi:hypothetical protein GO013_07290 [Pseudodesulfovibrio sp. JC047]|uniref:phage capsid protein n=1 Tax=Pseudodesulfovibrio sp. JC047 TaxID=2683199 RepID=UPI0013D2B761|nr:phage capsid protein [Pseudodesulfovibrio sp. JC047]NDV19222.1 hypothetical protein [Pseudodesulfovibrio sp. JC047]